MTLSFATRKLASSCSPAPPSFARKLATSMPTSTIGADTVIEPFVQLIGNTKIGANCRIRSFSIITNCEIGDNVLIRPGCIMDDSVVRSGAEIGPYSRLRPGSDIGEGAHVGNFVETKKTRLGKGSKANHLYLPGRRRDRRRRECGSRHHHLQLRWREQAPHRHRRRSICGQRYHSGRAGSHRARSLHWRCLLRHARMFLPTLWRWPAAARSPRKAGRRIAEPN